MGETGSRVRLPAGDPKAGVKSSREPGCRVLGRARNGESGRAGVGEQFSRRLYPILRNRPISGGRSQGVNSVPGEHPPIID